MMIFAPFILTHGDRTVLAADVASLLQTIPENFIVDDISEIRLGIDTWLNLVNRCKYFPVNVPNRLRQNRKCVIC